MILSMEDENYFVDNLVKSFMIWWFWFCVDWITSCVAWMVEMECHPKELPVKGIISLFASFIWLLLLIKKLARSWLCQSVLVKYFLSRSLREFPSSLHLPSSQAFHAMVFLSTFVKKERGKAKRRSAQLEQTRRLSLSQWTQVLWRSNVLVYIKISVGGREVLAANSPRN